MTTAALLLAASLASAAEKGGGISEDITVRSKAAGPGVEVAPPAASQAVVDEVLKSLSLGRGRTAPAAERIGVEADPARVKTPFPKGPFLSFSGGNIAAVYDRWDWEVVDDLGRVFERRQGVGELKERLDWEGISTQDGGFLLETGRSYRYKFTGRRGDREFVVESEPLPIASFTHLEYVGDTRVEAALALLFDPGARALSKSGEKWIEHFSSQLRLGTPRPDGTYKLELAMKDSKSALAAARAKTLRRKLAASLVVDVKKIELEAVPALRGEALAAILPPSYGAPIRVE